MEGHGVEDVWSTEQMRENRHSWSLAADTALLSHIQQFSQNLLNETHTVLKSLDSLESDLNTACVKTNTVANKFLSLADTQFVENRVYDDEEMSSPGDTASEFNKENLDGNRENVIAEHIKEALLNGLQVVSTKFKIVEIPDSDSEEDESSTRSGMVLKPINPYQDRVLPHLIGSVEFNHDDSLGLRENQSDEETEEAVSISDKAESETEDSEPESDQTKVQESNGPMDSFRSGVSFSEQLAARLGGVGQQEDHLKSMSGNIFTVPIEEDDSDSLFFGDSRSSEDKSKNLFSDEQSPDLWTDNTDEDSKLFVEDKNLPVENLLQSSQVQDALHSKYNDSINSNLNKKNKKTGKTESLFDDTDEGSDLFHDVQPSGDTVKKKMPPGAVSIFGTDVDLFGEKAVPFLSAPGSDKLIGTKHKIESNRRIAVNRSENQVDDVMSVRSSVTLSKSSDSRLQDGEEDDYDDLFSSTCSSSTEKSSKVKSEINVASKSRSTANHDRATTPPALNGNSSLIRNKKMPLFDSPDEDLFAGGDIFSSNSSKKPFKLFEDDNLFDEDKKSDLFDDLFANSDTKFHENDILYNEGLFKNKNSTKEQKTVGKDDNSSDNKIFNNPVAKYHMIKGSSEDLFSYNDPSNSDSLQNSEGDLSSRHFDGDDLLTDNSSNASGIKRSSTENLFKGYNPNLVSESESMFSHNSTSKPFAGSMGSMSRSSKETVSVMQNIFNDSNYGSGSDDIFSNLGSHNRLSTHQSNASDPFFTDSLSNSSSVKPINKIDISHSNNAEPSVNNKKTFNPNQLLNSPDLFGDEDKDDLFKIGGSKKLISKTEASISHQASKNSGSNSFQSIKTGSQEADVKSLFTDDSEDLFGTGPSSFSGSSSLLSSKAISTTAKSKKLLGMRPLFDDSDSDDDLFSSPRGSLGSKKSQSSVNLSQDVNAVLKKNLLDDATVRKQSENMEYDLFRALKSTSKNNDLFADVMNDDEGSGDSDLFSALKPSDAKQKIPDAEKKDEHNTATNEITSVAKSVQNSNDISQKEGGGKQLEPFIVSPGKIDFRRDSGGSTVSEKTSPGKLNADCLPNINPAALLPGTKPRLILSSSKALKTEQNLFPSRDEVSTLHNIVKDRPKIQVKRRLPSRRARQEALRGLVSDDYENICSKTVAAHERIEDVSTIMSPSTDEEDMFGVPPLETKVSLSPTDIFSESAIISPERSSIFTGPIQYPEFVTSDVVTPNIGGKQTVLVESEHENVHEIIASKKLTSGSTLRDNLNGIGANFDDRLFESNSNDTNQNSNSSMYHSATDSILNEDILSSETNMTKSFAPLGSILLGIENSGNIRVSADKDKASTITKLQNSAPKASHDFFGDSDSGSENLFSNNLESKPKSKLFSRKSLFDDENEDDDIFGRSVSASSSKNSDTVQKKSSESGSSKSNMFAKRPVKLTSHQAFTDPLMSNGD